MNTSTTHSGADALDETIGKACILAWDHGPFTLGGGDPVPTIFSTAFDCGYRVALSAAQDAPSARSGIPIEAAIAWQHTGTGVERTAVMVDGRTWYRDDDPKVIQAAQAVPQGLRVTEEMHVAACKVLTRAHGLYGLPQRMLDAMLAAAPAVPQPQEAAPESWDDLPKKLIEAARHNTLTWADRVAIGRAIARIQQAAPSAQQSRAQE